MKITLLIIAFLSVLTTPTFATTWTETEVIDPISGENTKVYNISSYGDYIYNWSSKYDAIFWPLTDEAFIRFNTKSGYIAFGSDFENLKEDEKQRLIPFLEENYDPNKPPTTHLEKIKWLERVYRVRGTDDEFKIRYYCLLSYLTREDKNESDKYRKRALVLIKEYLRTAKPSFYKAHLYIVAGFYFLLLKTGNEEDYWEKLTDLDLGIEDPEELNYSKEYLDKMLKELRSGEYKEIYFR